MEHSGLLDASSENILSIKINNYVLKYGSETGIIHNEKEI